MEYYIDKIHLSVNDPYRPRYDQIINKHCSAGRKYLDGLNKCNEYWNDIMCLKTLMIAIQKHYKIAIVFDSMIIERNYVKAKKKYFSRKKNEYFNCFCYVIVFQISLKRQILSYTLIPN